MDAESEPSRLRAWCVAVAVVVAALLPLTWPEDRDSFPITSYPMFADRLGDSSVTLHIAVGDTPEGPVPLPSEATGHRQVTQAVKALAAAVDDGGRRPASLCAEIAAWVADSGRRDIDLVRIVTASFDGVSYFADGARAPRIVAEHARCPVER